MAGASRRALIASVKARPSSATSMLIEAVDAPREPPRMDVALHLVAGDRDGPCLLAEVVDQMPERVANRATRATLLHRVVGEQHADQGLRGLRFRERLVSL